MTYQLNFLSRLLLAGLTGLAASMGVRADTSADGVASRPQDTRLVALGRQLFFDPRLSSDSTVSCSSCHQPKHAFTDGRDVSIGVGKLTGTRNTPSLLNVMAVMDGSPLFWDGRRDRLDIAVLDPLTNPIEMAQPNLNILCDQLSHRADYAAEVSQVFPGAQAITPTQLGKALAAFIHSLPKSATPYDRYAAGQSNALDHDALAGLRLFDGKAGCAGCHATRDARFTDEGFHHSGVGMSGVESHLGQLSTDALRRNLQGGGLGTAVAQQPELSALGRFLVTHHAGDVGAFRTPSLREVGATAPYMHDGSVKTLEEAVDVEIYYRGLSTGNPINLTARERQELLAFLRSLTPPSKR